VQQLKKKNLVSASSVRNASVFHYSPESFYSCFLSEQNKTVIK